jgi:hypothetical protein
MHHRTLMPFVSLWMASVALCCQGCESHCISLRSAGFPPRGLCASSAFASEREIYRRGALSNQQLHRVGCWAGVETECSSCRCRRPPMCHESNTCRRAITRVSSVRLRRSSFPFCCGVQGMVVSARCCNVCHSLPLSPFCTSSLTMLKLEVNHSS